MAPEAAAAPAPALTPAPAAAPAPALTLGPCIMTAALMTVVGGFVDAYTYLSHGVFALAQTGNVIFLAAGLVKGQAALVFLWPVLAYCGGLTIAQMLKRLPSRIRVARALMAVLLTQALVLLVIGALPAGVPAVWITIPLSAIAGLQIALFRTVSDISFISIATTGNLMRFIEALAGLATKRGRTQLRAVSYTALIVVAFATGAVSGALATENLGQPAIVVAGALQLAVLALFVRDARRALAGTVDTGRSRHDRHPHPATPQVNRA